MKEKNGEREREQKGMRKEREMDLKNEQKWVYDPYILLEPVRFSQA